MACQILENVAIGSCESIRAGTGMAHKAGKRRPKRTRSWHWLHGLPKSGML